MSRFGVARLTEEYEQVTQQVTSAASDMGRSLEDLKQHASRFSQVFSITRHSEESASKNLTLAELLAKKRGIVSLHEAFANMQTSERMHFVSASQWLDRIRNSPDIKIDGNFITSGGFDDVCAALLALLSSDDGASLIAVCTALSCDMPVAKEVVARLINKGDICVDESIEGVKYFKNIFVD